MNKKLFTIAIAGNPNSGKTSLFNRLTKANQHVANYPGITVEYAEGESVFENIRVNIIDLPGTYSLTAYSPEEVVARDFILKEDIDLILNIVDASNLERNLYLTTQLITLNFPMVIALNMIDSAEMCGIAIDNKRLADILGVKVVPTIAKSGHGVEELKRACIQTIQEGSKIKKLSFPHPVNDIILQVEKEIEKTNTGTKKLPSKWLALKLLEDDPLIIEMLRESGNPAIFAEYEKAKKFLEFHSGDDSRTAIVEAYYSIASGVCRDCIRMSEMRKRHISDRIDQIACNRFIGPILLFLIVYLLFAVVFKISDEWKWVPLFNGEFESPTGTLELFFDYLSELTKNNIQNDFIRSLISNGIISGVGGVLSFTPLIFFMFLFIAAIEDTGYMARIAFILDRVLRIFGLQGKSILPLLLTGGIGGGGCAVPGILAARTMREEKDRLITILVTPMMNCGAKLPVYAMLISAFFYESKTQMMFTLWFLSWLFTLSAAFLLRKFFIKGEQTPFVMELPIYHLPTLRGVMLHSLQRTWMYVKKAGTIILLINLIMWLIMSFPKSSDRTPEENLRNSIAGRLGQILEPVSSLAGFKWRENIALIGGFAAKEIVVSTLATAYSLTDIDPENTESLSKKLSSQADWNKVRAFAMMVFVMLYAPCFPTIVTIRKETGKWKWACFSTIYSTIFAFIIASVIFQIGSLIF